MREFFKDFYGSSASIRTEKGGEAILTVKIYNGETIHHKRYNTRRGARVAMGKLSDGWRKAGQWD